MSAAVAAESVLVADSAEEASVPAEAAAVVWAPAVARDPDAQWPAAAAAWVAVRPSQGRC